MAKSQNKTDKITSNGVVVKFTISPIGAYGLSHFEGDEVELPVELAETIVKNGHAVYIDAIQVSETNEEKKPIIGEGEETL